jgi:hypothetical protein
MAIATSQGSVSAIMVTHWYMARKNPPPAAITNSVLLVSGIIDPPQRPRAGTLFRLDLGSFVAFCRGLPFRIAGTLPQAEVAGPGPLYQRQDVPRHVQTKQVSFRLFLICPGTAYGASYVNRPLSRKPPWLDTALPCFYRTIRSRRQPVIQPNI